MSEEIRQIAERLVGLRDALDLRPEDIASTCNIDLETYLGYESGEKRHSGQFSAPDSQALRRRIAGIDVRIRTPNELLFPYPKRQRCRRRAYKSL